MLFMAGLEATLKGLAWPDGCGRTEELVGGGTVGGMIMSSEATGGLTWPALGGDGVRLVFRSRPEPLQPGRPHPFRQGPGDTENNGVLTTALDVYRHPADTDHGDHDDDDLRFRARELLWL